MPVRVPPFSLTMPAGRSSCLVFNSPHSGRHYPDEFVNASRLTRLQMRSSEDAFVEELFGAAPAHGAPLLAASVPRAYVDLNRDVDDLDPALVAGAEQRFLSPRVAAGLGVIPRVVSEGRVIMSGKITMAEARERINACWHPYHDQLKALLMDQRDRFGMAVLIDCHSMPRDAICAATSTGGRRPNVVLGDRFGAACDRWLVDAAAEVFAAAGYVVARNAPFAGGHITQSYGRPRENVHALQIELDRGLYMDERKVERLECFEEARARISNVVSGLAALGPQALPVAAE